MAGVLVADGEGDADVDGDGEAEPLGLAVGDDRGVPLGAGAVLGPPGAVVRVAEVGRPSGPSPGVAPQAPASSAAAITYDRRRERLMSLCLTDARGR